VTPAAYSCRVILPRTGVAAVVLTVAGALGGCTTDTSDGGAEPAASSSPSPSATSPSSPTQDSTPSPVPNRPSAPAPTPAADLQRFYGQQLEWSECRDAQQCSTLRVPLDYAKPAGRSITLSLLKVPARDQGRRLGSMVVNPGGPGGSGVDYADRAADTFGTPLLRSYDVVGFDPRGVGESTPVQCGPDERLNALVESDPDPDTAAERRRSDALIRALGVSCLRDTGELVRHVSTGEVARDLDILRAALGDERLTYFGASYGTFIGATYAELFPARVGRLVLDGALDPAASTLEVNLVQARGFEVALRAYVASCVEKGSCYLGSSVDEGVRRVQTFLADVERTPLRTSSERTVAAGEAVYGLWLPLYDQRSWPVLDQALAAGLKGDGSRLLQVADAYLQRTPDDRFLDNSFEVFPAINCLDRDDAVPSSQVARLTPRFEKASPTFGSTFAYSVSTCSSWPVHSGRTPRPVRAEGSAPIMVVGTTRDPATPLVWARALARQLDDAVLVTRDGDGHTGYRQGNACTDSAVERYLVSGTVPATDVSCS
jgi:pimeloyl-ACP methyl ester carboxylesterase